MPTPASSMGSFWRWAGAVIFFACVAVAVVAVLINLGHKADVNNLQHQGVMASVSASVQSNSLQYNRGQNDALSAAWQTMHQDAETEGQVPASAVPQVKAAVLGDGQLVCYYYTLVNQHIVTVAPDITTWVHGNCDGTSVSETSSLRK